MLPRMRNRQLVLRAECVVCLKQMTRRGSVSLTTLLYLMAAAGETEAARLASLLVDDVAEPRDEVVGDGEGVSDVRLEGDEAGLGSGESRSGDGERLAFSGEETDIWRCGGCCCCFLLNVFFE